MPPILAENGVGQLFGTLVTDPQMVLAIVSQAGGTQRFKSATKKIYRRL